MDGMRNRVVQSQLHTFHADAPLPLSSLPGPPFFLTCRNVVATLILIRSPRDTYVLDLSE